MTKVIEYAVFCTALLFDAVALGWWLHKRLNP